MSTQSPADLHAWALEHLGQGDEVTVAEALKHAAIELAAAVDSGQAAGSEAEKALAAALGRMEAPAEKFLALALPLIEYRPDAASLVLPRALDHMARSSSLVAQSEVRWDHHALVLVLGRLTRVLTAFLLHTRRTSVLVALNAATFNPAGRYEVVSEGLLMAGELRHPLALADDASKAATDYKTWAEATSVIREGHPLFVAELDQLMDEADIVLALAQAVAGGWSVYVNLLTSIRVQQVAWRISQPGVQREFAEFFGVAVSAFEDQLNEAFERLRTKDGFFERPPASLFPAEVS